MAENSNTFLKDLFNNIADYDPTFICERKASKYLRQYYNYKGIKITITKETITHDIVSITLTKF